MRARLSCLVHRARKDCEGVDIAGHIGIGHMLYLKYMQYLWGIAGSFSWEFGLAKFDLGFDWWW